MTLTTRTLLLLIAVIIFVIYGLGIDIPGNVNLIGIGLAVFAAAFLVPDRALDTRR